MLKVSKHFKRFIGYDPLLGLLSLLSLLSLARPSFAAQAIYCVYSELDGSQSVAFSGVYASGQWLKVDEQILVQQVPGSNFKRGGDLFRVTKAIADEILEKCQAVEGPHAKGSFLQARTPYYSYGMIRVNDGYPVVFKQHQPYNALTRVGSVLHTTGESVIVVGSKKAKDPAKTHPTPYFRVSHSAEDGSTSCLDITADKIPSDYADQFDVVIFEELAYESWGPEQLDRALTNAYQLLRTGGRLFSSLPLRQLRLESELDEIARNELVKKDRLDGVRFSTKHPILAYVSEEAQSKNAILLARAFQGGIGYKLADMGLQPQLTTEVDVHWTSAESGRTEVFFKATKL